MVLLGAVVLGGGEHRFGRAQTVLAPRPAAGERPLQDAGQLLEQPVEQGRILVVGGHLGDEGDHADPTPDGVVSATHGRAVVGCHPQLVGGAELEEVLTHTPGLDGVAAGELLHGRLGEPAALVGLLHHHQAPAEQIGHASGVPLMRGGQQQVGLGRGGVVAHQLLDDRQERALAVRSPTVQEEQALLGHGAGERVAHGALDELDELAVALHRPVDEPFPCGAGGGRVDGGGCELGDELVAVLGGDLTGAQVDSARAGVQDPRVGVERSDGDGDAGLGAGDVHHGVEAGCALRLVPVSEQLLAGLVAFHGGELGEHAVDDGLGTPVGFAGDVFGPACAVPHQPGAPLGCVAQVVAVVGDEAARVAEIGVGLVDGAVWFLVVVGTLGEADAGGADVVVDGAGHAGCSSTFTAVAVVAGGGEVAEHRVRPRRPIAGFGPGLLELVHGGGEHVERAVGFVQHGAGALSGVLAGPGPLRGVTGVVVQLPAVGEQHGVPVVVDLDALSDRVVVEHGAGGGARRRFRFLHHGRGLRRSEVLNPGGGQFGELVDVRRPRGLLACWVVPAVPLAGVAARGRGDDGEAVVPLDGFDVAAEGAGQFDAGGHAVEQDARGLLGAARGGRPGGRQRAEQLDELVQRAGAGLAVVFVDVDADHADGHADADVLVAVAGTPCFDIVRGGILAAAAGEPAGWRRLFTAWQWERVPAGEVVGHRDVGESGGTGHSGRVLRARPPRMARPVDGSIGASASTVYRFEP